MPVQVSYPGVYIQELPSGTRNITGVATSITAFVGRAARGPTDTAITISSQGDYDRQFGGLSQGSTMSFSVRDFFANGGSSAVIVRLYAAASSGPTATAAISVVAAAALGTPLFKLAAANPGVWGQNLAVVIDNNVSADTATAMGVTVDKLFNITVTDTASGITESMRNVTLVESSRRLDRVLAQTSNLIAWPAGAPATTTIGNIDYTAALSDAVSGYRAVLAAAVATLARAAPADVAAATLVVTKATTAVTTALTAVGGNDGTTLTEANWNPNGAQTNKVGLYALEQVDLFNILVIPPTTVTASIDPTAVVDVDPTFVSLAATYCETRRAMLLVDSPATWTSITNAKNGFNGAGVGTRSANAALFFPRLVYPNPFHDNQLEDFSTTGAVAGVMARTDSQRGVWKAPAGLDAILVGVPQLSLGFTDLENGTLNTLGINCLRSKAGTGPVIWGSRTLQGDDRVQSQWKYISVRRTALYIEESVFEGMQWVVFEPNDEPLWSQIRTNVGAFMQGLFLQGAFQGQSPDEAYFVKCDDETTTQTDIDSGIVNVIVGFAPLKSAEFVVISLQQMAGQTAGA